MKRRLSKATVAFFVLACVFYLMSWMTAFTGIVILGIAFEALTWVSFLYRDDKADDETGGDNS